MIGNKKYNIFLLFFLILFMLWIRTVAAQEDAIFYGEKIIFSEIFKNLTWKYNQQVFHSKLPTAKVEDINYTGQKGEMIDTVYTGISLKYLGLTSIDVVHDEEQDIHFINISTIDSREKCSPGHPGRPKDCRNILDKTLIGILENTKNYIVSCYGRPKTSHLDDMAGESGEKIPNTSYKWHLNNVNIILGLNEDDDGSWAVVLSLLNKKYLQ
jgi:hypothetical protein